MPLEKDMLKRLTTFVNCFGLSMIAVCEKLHIGISFNKSGVCVGINAPGSRVATLISLYGEGTHGTLSIFMNEGCFASFVQSMTRGMIAPDPDDPIALSVAGEVSNMVSGNAVTSLSERGYSGLDITPPQILTGSNIKTLRLPEETGYTFTLPFLVENDPDRIIYQVLLFRR